MTSDYHARLGAIHLVADHALVEVTSPVVRVRDEAVCRHHHCSCDGEDRWDCVVAPEAWASPAVAGAGVYAVVGEEVDDHRQGAFHVPLALGSLFRRVVSYHREVVSLHTVCLVVGVGTVAVVGDGVKCLAGGG